MHSYLKLRNVSNTFWTKISKNSHCGRSLKVPLGASERRQGKQLRQETKASFVASKAASAEMKEKALVSTMSLSVQNLPIIVQKLSKKIQRKSINSKTFKIYPKFFLKTELREMKEKALVSTVFLFVQNRLKIVQKILRKSNKFLNHWQPILNSFLKQIESKKWRRKSWCLLCQYQSTIV